MPNPRGRPSKEALAQRALAEATQAAQQVESSPEPSPEPVETEERSDIVLRPPRNDVRERAMKEITDRDIQTKTSLGMELGLNEDEKPKVVEKVETPQDPAPPTAESMLQGGKFSPATSKQIVDGQTYDVPQSEIDDAGGEKAWRIARAAENRLQKAQEALAEVRKLQGETREQKPKESPNEALKKDIEILRWGTPDESAEAFTRILESRNKPLDQDMIVQMAADRIRHDDAVKSFDKEFTDIGASPLHLKLVMALREEKLKQGHPGDWTNFYRSLGNEVRSVMIKQPQPNMTAKSPDTPSQLSVKEERKSSIVNLPTATAQRAELPEEPKTETRDEIFAKMRKKRGLPTT
jgi:hypothetical protein